MANVGTVVETISSGGVTLGSYPQNPGLTKWSFAWTSAANGVVNYTMTHPITGVLLAVGFTPSANPAPSNNYAFTIKDENGVDILAGQGSALSNTTATVICPGVFLKDGTTTGTSLRALSNTLVFAGSSAGNATQGTIDLYTKL